MSEAVATCVGVVTLDVVAIVDSFPEVEGRTEARDIFLTGGGTAANAAVVLARQGVPTAFAGLVGDDQAGRRAVELLRAEGVDTSGVQVSPGAPTQTSCVIVDSSTSSRSIMTTAAAPLTGLSERARTLIAGSRWVHVDHRGYGAVRDLVPRLGSAPRVSLDSGNAPVPDLDLSGLDLYVPTLKGLLLLQGADDPDEAAHRALSRGCHAVVATDGERGARGWWDEEGAAWTRTTGPGSVAVPAYDVGTVVSTLGAGDVFHGALISALCRDCTWEEALRWANITAGLSTRGRDGREGVPTADRVRSLLHI